MLLKGGIAELVEHVREVCPLPATAQRVVSLCEEPDAHIEQVAEVVATDAALAAEVMKIANSPLFGGVRKISDLGRAVMMLGFNELKSMAVAMSLLATFRSKDDAQYQFHDTAVLSATVNRGLVELLEGNRTAAFLCGLLCEIGAMACVAVDSDGFAELWNQADGDLGLREELEIARYGAPTYQVGARLLQRNGLPADVVTAVGTPFGSEAHPLLGRTTALSRILAPIVIEASDANDDAWLREQLEQVIPLSATGLNISGVLDVCDLGLQIATKAIQRAS